MTKKLVLAMELSRVEAASGWLPLTTDFGGYSYRVTPVPIPNTEVKPVRADGTWVDSPWESRSPPDFSSEDPLIQSGGLRRFRLRCARARAAPFPFAAPAVSGLGPEPVRRAAAFRDSDRW